MLSKLLSALFLLSVFVDITFAIPTALSTRNRLIKRTNPSLDNSFGANDVETQQIKDAFFDAQELINYAITEDIDRNGPIFGKYFNTGDKATVRDVFFNIAGRPADINNPPDTTGSNLLGSITVTRSDPDGDCAADPTIMAQLTSYTSQNPLLEVCPKAGFGHGGIGKDPNQVNCDTIGDTVSWRMETLGSILLHEYTHYKLLVAPPLPKETDDLDGGYGPNGVRALDKTLATNNADSYSWYANAMKEVLWTVLCGKTFNDPGPGDDDDPNCDDNVCKATKASP